MANLTAQQKEVIRRSQQSVSWWLSNFGRLKHPSAGILPFKPFTYQKHAIKCFRQHRLNIFRKCRQSGVSKIAGAFATWFAMFHAHKTVLIVSRRNEDAMGFLRDHVVFLYEHLPPWMKEVWKPVKQNEHEIIFPNGSRIQSLTSHPEVLRGNAASLNIIDESGFIQGMDTMWAAGWPCSRGDTLIQTENGLIKIEQLAIGGDPWKFLDIEVASDEGYTKCDKGFVSGVKPTIIINSYLGFEYEGTNHHRLRIIDNNGDYVWSRLDELQPNNLIVSIPGQFIGKRRYLKDGFELGVDFAEILGLYVGDGSLSTSRPKRFRIFFDPQDVETRNSIIIKFNKLFDLNEKAHDEFGGTTENFRLNSAEFVSMMIENGLNSKTCPQDAQIPDLILKSDEIVLCAFIRGLFDSDGWCYQSSTCMKLGFSTTSEKLAEQVQVALHALNILTRRILVEPSHSKNEDRYSDDPYWRVDVWDAHSKLTYKNKIGFLTQRKQDCLNNFSGSNEFSEIEHEALVLEFAEDALSHILNGKSFRQCEDGRKWNLNRIKRLGKVRLSLVKELTNEFNLDNRLSKYISRGFYFDTVEGIRTGECETFDLSVPLNNTYLANGMVSHNTLQHGGNVIVISTTNGIGNWYWNTWTDAEAGVNGFNPIMINWWDMDWVIEYKDPLSLDWKRIAPRDGIRKSADKSEINRFGPYWSPWLQEQYNALQEQGDGWKFDQEILASFVGSGHTVLSKEVLTHIQTTVKEPEQKVTGYQTYVHPVSGVVEDINFDFQDPEQGLWIWKKPVVASTMKKRGSLIVDQGSKAHSYAMGVDIATGKGRDYSTIEVFDIDTMEQVAEFMAHCLPRELVKYIDRIGRWYNCALAVVERNNGGDTLIDSLRYDVMYPRIWRKKDINDKPRIQGATTQRAMKVAHYGFSTSMASKPTLNKFLIDFLSENADDGYKIYSVRLLKQLQTYVRKRDRTGRDTNKTEAEDGSGNHDDLVIACALAFVGTSDAFMTDSGNLIPVGSGGGFGNQTGPTIFSDSSQVGQQKAFAEHGGSSLLMPMALAPDEIPNISAQRHIDAYTLQLGAIPIGPGGPIITPPKYFYTRK